MACFFPFRCRARAQVLPCQESAFRVTLEAELKDPGTDWPLSQGWGLVVSSDEALRELVIVNIQESTSVKHWNLEHPECPIEVGQAILEVNGKTERNEMLEAPELWGKTAWKDGKVLIQMLIDVQLTPRQRSFFNLAIRRYDVVDEFLEATKVAHNVCMVEPCTICQDALDGSSDVVRLSCGHHFHKCCAQKRFFSQKNFRCPCCNNLLGGWN
ncbi:unnamed protein product [Durusdinium trenchii]|uniref:RING-type domain-containing protein n=1 Tax=Durusdinium trenchii TaxID=1381693 RepID=A0ABP0IS05_9DINO